MKKFAALLLLAAACTNASQNGFNRFLANCNRVDIVVFNGGDTLFFNTQDSTGIRILKDQISGSQQNIADTCSALGVLRFRQDSILLLEAPFATNGDKKDARCNYVAYTHDDASHVHGLSERANKLLHTVMQQAGK